MPARCSNSSLHRSRRDRRHASKTFGKTLRKLKAHEKARAAYLSVCVRLYSPLDMVAVLMVSSLLSSSCSTPCSRTPEHRAIGSVDERRGGVERGAGSWLLQLTESVLVVGGKKSTCKLCAPSSCSSSRPRPAAARCRWWPRTDFICNPRLHDLAQRVVGRDLIELKRSRALRTYGRGQGCARRSHACLCGVAARASPPG